MVSTASNDTWLVSQVMITNLNAVIAKLNMKPSELNMVTTESNDRKSSEF
ncbi:6228_t:CDS:2 [Rhizophagus irregularis]|nr:6228_t:CDS:2 [Rhizophagus irregularis]